MKFLDSISIGTVLLICVALGLTPFTPPHIWEKTAMLFAGTLTQPLDIFDFFMHGTPWLLLVAKLARMARVGMAEED